MLFQEKRRVSIAFDLVTSEPASGFDTYNAFNVVESLTFLVRDYNRTVIFTTHQPRRNISLFDQLVLLAAGKLVLSMYNLIFLRWIEY
jgi:ABC-type multidrug transport system ATPase subunit